MSSGTLVQAEQLENFVQALFVHAGMAPEPARYVAKALLWAELRGIDTHGVGRVGFYLNFIQKGVINTQATWQVLHDTPAVQVFDANASAGAVAMFHAVTQAALKARALGIGLVMVRGTTHTGALGCFTQALAKQGMVGVALAASLPLMAYHGASAAGQAFAAALLDAEVHEMARQLGHRHRLPHHHHAARAHGRAQGLEALVIHRGVE